MAVKNVWIIAEDNHGTIGVASSPLAAKQWLIEIEWVTKNTQVWIPQTRKAVSLGELYGDSWEEHFLSYNGEELEELGYYFSKVELIEEK